MSKKISIIIKQTNKKVGNAGNIIQVARGYAFNYLIPENIAEIATSNKIKYIQKMQSIEKLKFQEMYNKSIKVQSKLEEVIKISVRKKVGEYQQIFGKTSEKEIIAQILYATGEILSRRQIILPEIKRIGIYDIKIQILQDVAANLKLQLLPDETLIIN